MCRPIGNILKAGLKPRCIAMIWKCNVIFCKKQNVQSALRALDSAESSLVCGQGDLMAIMSQQLTRLTSRSIVKKGLCLRSFAWFPHSETLVFVRRRHGRYVLAEISLKTMRRHEFKIPSVGAIFGKIPKIVKRMQGNLPPGKPVPVAICAVPGRQLIAVYLAGGAPYYNGAMCMFNKQTGALARTWRVSSLSDISHICCIHKKDAVAAASPRDLLVFDIQRDKQYRIADWAGKHTVSAILSSPSGRFLVLCRLQGLVQAFDLKAGITTRIVPSHPVWSAAFSPGSKQVYFGSNGTIKIFSAKAWHDQRRPIRLVKQGAMCMSASPMGRLLGVGLMRSARRKTKARGKPAASESRLAIFKARGSHALLAATPWRPGLISKIVFVKKPPAVLYERETPAGLRIEIAALAGRDAP